MRKISAKIISAILIASMVMGSSGIVTLASEVEDNTEIAFDVNDVETSEAEEVGESDEIGLTDDEDAEEIVVEEDTTLEEDITSEEEDASSEDEDVVIEDEEVIIPEEEIVDEENSSEEGFDEDAQEEIPENEESDEAVSEDLSDEEIEIDEELLEADGETWGDPTDIAGSENLSDKMLWRITEDGTLIVKGTGEYPKYEDDSAYPAWYEFYWKIKSAEIEVSGITSLKNFFAECYNLKEVNLSKLDTSKVTNFERMFSACSSLSIIDLTGFKTDNATTFNRMFASCINLLTLDLSSFKTSKVTDMYAMFYDCRRLTTLDLSSFDTSVVTDMGSMFENCYFLTSIDISSFNTGKVTTFALMFYDCHSLTSIDVSKFTTAKCTDFDYMFAYSGVNELDLSLFNTSAATSFANVFYSCYYLEEIQFPAAGLDLSKVDYLTEVFEYCTALKELNLLNFKVKDSVDAWTTFSNTNLEKIVLPLNHKNTINWGLSDYGYINLKGNPYSTWLDTSDIENITFVTYGSAFYSAYNKFGKTDDIPEGLWVEGIPDSAEYTGEAIRFYLNVFNGSNKLYEGYDYTVSYKNNKNVNNPADSKKKPTVIIKGKGDFTGTYEFKFDIKAVELNSYNIVKHCEEKITVNSKGVLPNPVLINERTALKKGTDFKMTVYDADTETVVSKIKKAGNYRVVLQGKGNYTGEYVYNIVAEEGLTDINKVKIKTIPSVSCKDYPMNLITDISYKGDPLVLNTDYIVEEPVMYGIGTNYLVVKGIGKYTGTKKISFKITQRKMSRVTFSDFPKSLSTVSDIYEVIEKQVPLTDKDYGTKLELCSDYLVNVTKIDYAKKKATVSFKGINDYTGKITKTIKLIPVDISKDSDSVQINIYSNEYSKGGFDSFVIFRVYYGTGYYDYNKAYEGTDYSVSGKISKNNGVYEVKVTVKGKGRFTGTRTDTVVMSRNNLLYGSVEAKDVKYSKKAGNYKTSPKVYDRFGYLLKSGTDYSGKVTYRYVNETTVINNGESVVRAGGSIADKNDIVPAKTVMKVTVDGTKYYTGSVSGIYTVNTGTVASAKVSVKAQTYTGQLIYVSPEDITVKVGKTTLKYGEDYKIVPGSYYLNRYKGTAYFKIEGCGDYSGEKLVTFKIKAKLFDKFL